MATWISTSLGRAPARTERRSDARVESASHDDERYTGDRRADAVEAPAVFTTSLSGGRGLVLVPW
jgi:hypothetical protein